MTDLTYDRIFDMLLQAMRHPSKAENFSINIMYARTSTPLYHFCIIWGSHLQTAADAVLILLIEGAWG